MDTQGRGVVLSSWGSMCMVGRRSKCEHVRCGLMARHIHLNEHATHKLAFAIMKQVSITCCRAFVLRCKEQHRLRCKAARANTTYNHIALQCVFLSSSHSEES